MKKAILVMSLFLALTGTLLIVAFAHGGKADANGGHYNHNTGEYHYHHGYSAHSHYDMDGDGDIDCPYAFDDKTNHGSGKIDRTPETTKKTDLQDLFDRTTTAPETEITAPKNEDKKDVFQTILAFLILFALTFVPWFFLAGLAVSVIRSVYESSTSREMNDITFKILLFIFAICFAALFFYFLAK